jgi:hypothetical protein
MKELQPRRAWIGSESGQEAGHGISSSSVCGFHRDVVDIQTDCVEAMNVPELIPEAVPQATGATGGLAP